ncbi:MAG TPA: hypothetical protein VN428_14930 [Bryobacteraceae bacterium]|nr:hypothetical protein [Bryobacteraceae bacterium]
MNGASFLPRVAASTWITIWGTDFSTTTRTWGTSDFANNDLPSVLEGVSATVNGMAAYISYVSPTQLNVLTPDDPATGEVQVQVTTANGASNTFAVNKSRVSPAFFQFTTKYAAAVHAGAVLVGRAGLMTGASFAPAQPGETLMLFGTGFGPTNPPLPASQLVTKAAPLAETPTVTIGGKPATVTFAGLSGSGLTQLNVTIPPDLPDGDALLVAQIAGAATQPDVFITIGRPWKIIGPGGGGSMFHPTISPHDPNLAVLSCDMTGAYITKDGGTSWREFNLRTTVSAFAFDPVHPNVVYAGSDGLFRSDDRGETWRLVFPDPKITQERMVGDHAEHAFHSTDPIWPGAGAQVQAIRVDPDNADRVYVAIAWWGAPRLFYTLDGGNTWRASATLGNQTVLNLFVDPTTGLDSRRLVVVTNANVYSVDIGTGSSGALAPPATAIRDVAGARDPDSGALVLYVTTAEGVWKSGDGGQSWQTIRSLQGFAPGYTRITAAERNPRILYVGADPDLSSGSEYGILKSTDGGETWAWVHHVQNWRDPSNKVLGWLDRDLPGWAGPPAYGLSTNATGQVLYATDSGTAYRTLDGGATWAAVYSSESSDGASTSRGLDVTTSYGVHFDPFNKDHLAISYTDVGPFHSINGGASWKRIANGAPKAWVNTCYWLEFDPEVKNRAWSVWGGAHDLPRPKMFKPSLAKYYVGGVCRTDDPNMQWHSCSADLGATTHVIVDPKSPPGSRTLYVTTFGNAGLATPAKPGGVFKSSDGGLTWTLKAEGMAAANRNAWRLVQAPDGTLYVLIARGLVPGTSTQLDGAIYKSTDGAEHWQRVTLPAGANAPNDMALDPTNPSRMYLACWPRTVNGENQNGGLFITDDGGATWRLAFDQSPHVYGVALDPDDPSTVFINTFEGAAYRSTDSGATWQRLGGYNFKWGHRPVPDPVNKGLLYLTTFGSSVWHGPATGVTGALEDVYPF